MTRGQKISDIVQRLDWAIESNHPNGCNAADFKDARDEIRRLREALERVGSSEAFLVARSFVPGQDDELIARIDFAREALNTDA